MKMSRQIYTQLAVLQTLDNLFPSATQAPQAELLIPAHRQGT